MIMQMVNYYAREHLAQVIFSMPTFPQGICAVPFSTLGILTLSFISGKNNCANRQIKNNILYVLTEFILPKNRWTLFYETFFLAMIFFLRKSACKMQLYKRFINAHLNYLSVIYIQEYPINAEKNRQISKQLNRLCFLNNRLLDSGH